MSRFSGRQASKALHNLSHNRLHDSISTLPCYPRQVPRLHDNSVLYSGPLSYAALARRFSSKPNPASFFVRERADVARGNRNFVGIHDAGSADTKTTITLITDADNGMLHTRISKLVSILHLKMRPTKGFTIYLWPEVPHDIPTSPWY